MDYSKAIAEAIAREVELHVEAHKSTTQLGNRYHVYMYGNDGALTNTILIGLDNGKITDDHGNVWGSFAV